MPTKPEYVTTKQYLINTPIPLESRTYKPVSHEKLIDLTLESIYQAGFSLDKEDYTMSNEGQVATGRYTISNIQDSEMQVQIAIQNSYNKKVTLKFCLGTRIFVCENGCVSGDYGAFKKKHQGEIQTFTPKAITEYIKTAGDVFINMQKERDVMKNIELSRRVQAELLGRMYVENQFIETTQLNIIKRELDAPTFDYGDPNSLWSLFNYTTYALKGVHPTLWLDSHIDSHSFFTNESTRISGQLILPPKENKMLELIGEPIDIQMSWLDMIPRT